jgi:hypothetical protein
LYTYEIESNTTIEKSEKKYVENYIIKNIPSKKIKPGDEVTIKTELIKEAIQKGVKYAK